MVSILVVGGYGVVGSQFVSLLKGSHSGINMTLAGRKLLSGKTFPRELSTCNVVQADINEPSSIERLRGYDMIVSCVQDRGDVLIRHANRIGAGHIGITKAPQDVPPTLSWALRENPKVPIVLAGHWQAGIVTQVIRKISESFQSIELVEIAAVYDPRDPIGPMTAEDVTALDSQALIRRDYQWLWVDPSRNASTIDLHGSGSLLSYPIAVLDVPAIGAITKSPNVRFGFAGDGTSIGTLSGGAASHDVYISISGRSDTSSSIKRTILISDRKGNSHLTAVGILVSVENTLGLLGNNPLQGGIHLVDNIGCAGRNVERIKQFGVEIRNIV